MNSKTYLRFICDNYRAEIWGETDVGSGVEEKNKERKEERDRNKYRDPERQNPDS